MQKRKVNLSWGKRAQRLLGVLLLGVLFALAFNVDMPVCEAQEQCTAPFAPGTVVTLTATPCHGCKFVKWTCNKEPCPCAGQGKVCTFVMPPTPLTINAEFKKLVKPTWRRGM